MTFKFSVCLLPLLALVTLPLLADAAAGDCIKEKQCGTCTAATGSAGRRCLWCSFQIKKTPTSGTGTFLNMGLGFCLDGSTCPTPAEKVPSLNNFFPYIDLKGSRNDLEINYVPNEDCLKNLFRGVLGNKDSPLDTSITKCKDCTGTKDWCQFEKLRKTHISYGSRVYSGQSGGLCLDHATGTAKYTTYSVHCPLFVEMITAVRGEYDPNVVVGNGPPGRYRAKYCEDIDAPNCSGPSTKSCRNCLSQRCTYCSAVLKTTTTPTGGGTPTITYKTKQVGVCKPRGTECPTSFGTLSTATDYTVPATGSTPAKTYEMEVKPFGTYAGAVCETHDVSIRLVDKSTCASCVADWASRWCNVELSKPSGKVSGGFCSVSHSSIVCRDFREDARPGVYGATPSSYAECECHWHTKCGDCKAQSNCDWCAAKVCTNDINLGYCTTKGTPTACDKTKFGTLDALSTAAGKPFTVAPIGAAVCPSTKVSPLVMASKTCSTCAPSNTWCKLVDGTSLGGVCLNTGATAATHSTDCATLKTSFGMTTELSVTEVADCPKLCDTYTNCSDCKSRGTGCDWCDGSVGGTYIKLGYCTRTACEKTKFGTLDALLHFAGKKLDVSPLDTKDCPAATAAKNSPLETEMADCAACTAAANTWCQLGSNLGGTGNRYLSSGGVCLKSVANPLTTCPTLSTQLSMVNKMTTATANCPKPDCSKKSCDGCLTEGCMWCGVTVDNGKGTALGKCVSMPTTSDDRVCNGQTFGKMKDVLGYEIGSKIYKMEVVPFSLTKGWTEAQCNRDEVDATILPDCKTCIANEEKWCNVVLTDDEINNSVVTNNENKREGGICLGKNESSAKKICCTFAQPAKKNEAFKRTGRLTTNCGEI